MKMYKLQTIVIYASGTLCFIRWDRHTRVSPYTFKRRYYKSNELTYSSRKRIARLPVFYHAAFWLEDDGLSCEVYTVRKEG